MMYWPEKMGRWDTPGQPRHENPLDLNYSILCFPDFSHAHD